MTFTDNEKVFLKEMVKQTLEKVKKEESTIVHHEKVSFLAAEEKYEDFLERLLKKL